MSLARELSTPRISADPLARARRLTQRTHIAGATCVGIAGVWALWPVSTPQITIPDLSAPAEPSTRPEVPVLNLAAFDSSLWTSPPEPPAESVAAAPPPPPPPPPLKLQLLGIVGEPTDGTTVYRAALYDPDADRILVVTSGDTIAGRTVATVDRDAVSLALGSNTQTLALRSEQAPGKGGRR